MHNKFLQKAFNGFFWERDSITTRRNTKMRYTDKIAGFYASFPNGSVLPIKIS